MEKEQAVKYPSSLEAPKNLAGELKNTKMDSHIFISPVKFPKVWAANKQTCVWNILDWKIGNGSWASESGELLIEAGHQMLVDDIDVDPIDKGGWAEINIEKNTYYFRMFFQFQKPDGSIVKSPFSNIVEIGTPAFYTAASSWAKQELNKAAECGLIPDILKRCRYDKSLSPTRNLQSLPYCSTKRPLKRQLYHGISQSVYRYNK